MRYGFILAGGVGARLRPYTFVLPKPLIPLGPTSIIERVLRSLGAADVAHVAVSLGYLGHLVEAVLGDGTRFGVQVRYTREDSPLGTAGALRLFPFELADDDSVLVINGDTLTSLDMRAALGWFEDSGADAAMVCVERQVTVDFGVVEADEAGRLVRIREKPTTTNLLSTGINMLRGRVLREIGEGRVDMPDYLMALGARGCDVRCHVVTDLWMDLGRVEDLEAANDLVDRGML